MKLFSTLMVVATALLIGTEAQALTNSSQEFRLKTALKPGQSGKSKFNDLYLEVSNIVPYIWHFGISRCLEDKC
jgi:hypothetical protein